jgi:amino acid transporter
VLLVGILWIIAMAAICYVGIEISANFQKALLSIEVVMLVVLSVVALAKALTGHGPPGSLHPSVSWLSPLGAGGFQSVVGGLVLMLFIYWGWDTAVAVNEETKDRNKTPGRAAVISTVLLLLIYFLVIFSLTAFAGVGTKGGGLANPANVFDVLSVQGTAAFGSGGAGTFFTRLLILMVLSSAAASTQTTILPTARTTLSMAAYRALPKSFAKIHPRFLTPTVSTIVMAVVSIALYGAMNFIGTGNTVILDGYSAIGVYIAFYYGLTGFACFWYYRKTLTSSARNLWMRGILPLTGGMLMYALGGYALWETYDVGTAYSYTSWTMPFVPHWHMGGAFLISFLAAVAGVVTFTVWRIRAPAFFRKETLTRATPTLVPDPDA